MRSWTAFSLVLCSICGCSVDQGTSAASSSAVVGPVRLPPLTVSRVVPAAEAAVIERIVQYVPEGSRAVFREKLSTGRAIVQLDDPRGNLLIDSLELLRSRTSDRASRNLIAGQGNRSALGLVPATIALVQSLPVKGARAVVLRRATARPSDIILVTENTENRDLRNALGALFKARSRDGVVAMKDVRLGIYTTQSSARAHPTNSAKIIDWDVLRSADMEMLSGVGPARTISVQLKSATDRTQ